MAWIGVDIVGCRGWLRGFRLSSVALLLTWLTAAGCGAGTTPSEEPAPVDGADDGVRDTGDGETDGGGEVGSRTLESGSDPDSGSAGESPSGDSGAGGPHNMLDAGHADGGQTADDPDAARPERSREACLGPEFAKIPDEQWGDDRPGCLCQSHGDCESNEVCVDTGNGTPRCGVMADGCMDRNADGCRCAGKCPGICRVGPLVHLCSGVPATP